MYKDLYFINARELSERLQRDEISEELAFKHLLVASMFFASYISIPVVVSCSSGEAGSWWFQVMQFITTAAIQFWGMNLLYRINKSGDGKVFFLRLSALSLPVGVQVWVIALVLGAVYGGAVGLSAGGWASNASVYTWILTGIIFGIAMQVIHFKLMQHNLTIASNEAAKR